MIGSTLLGLMILANFQDRPLFQPEPLNIATLRMYSSDTLEASVPKVSHKKERTKSVLSSPSCHDASNASNASNAKPRCFQEGSVRDHCPSKKKVIILFWDPYWQWSDFGMGIGNAGFVRFNCTCRNCFTTTDKRQARFADAIIFHGQSVQQDNVRGLEKLKQQRLK